jgi:hypothetical protein
MEARGFQSRHRNTGDGYLGLRIRREGEFTDHWCR